MVFFFLDEKGDLAFLSHNFSLAIRIIFVLKKFLK